MGLVGYDWEPQGVDLATEQQPEFKRYATEKGDFVWQMGASLASEALATGKELLITPEHALHGDSGVSITLEGATPQMLGGLRLAAFLDAGAIKSDMDDTETRKSRDHLASVGLGLRYAHPGGINFTADYGYVVLGSRVNLPDNQNPAPQKGDDKLHLSLTYVF